MKKITAFYTIIWALAFSCYTIDGNAQKQGTELVDSLKIELAKSKEDTNKVKLFSKLCKILARTDNDEAMKYGNEGLQLTGKLNWEKGKALLNNSLARCYFNISDYEKSMSLAKSALKYFKTIQNADGMSAAYGNIADALDHLGNYSEALSNYFESYKINERTGLNEQLAPIASNIGNVYYHLENITEALKWYNTALQYCIKYKNESVAANTYSNIGLLYTKSNDLDKAKEYFFKAISMHMKLGHSHDFALEIGYGNLAEAFEGKHSFDSAMFYYEKSLFLSKQLNDAEGISFCYAHMGKILLHLKDYKKSRNYLDSSIIISKQIGSKFQLRDSYLDLFILDSTQKNYFNAIQNIEYYILYKDSLHNSEISEQTLKTAMKYEFSKKEDSLKHESEKKDFLNKEELKRQKNIGNFSLLGVLGLSFFLFLLFKQRNKIKKEKERSEELLLNILPADITDELKERGETTAKHFNEVTVMFTDFVEFTKIGEQLSPQVLVQELHECFSAFDAIIDKNGIEKIKTVGDAYIAVCGLPTENKKHAENCVKAAQEILQFMEERKRQEKVFEIRIGVHTGPVVAGIVGVKKFAYDIWGDTVNTASRMESSGEAGKINISETTYELVKSQFSCSHRGKISAKGKGEIDMYFVI